MSCCCHSRRGAGLAPPWAALPRCVRVALVAEQSLPKEAFSTQPGYHLTVKSCHSILGVFKSCPGSAGCSKVEIKANLLLWLRRRLVTSALILSEEIRDAPAGMGGQAQPCHAAGLMLIYTSCWQAPKLCCRVAQMWIRLAVLLGSPPGRSPAFSRWHWKSGMCPALGELGDNARQKCQTESSLLASPKAATHEC